MISIRCVNTMTVRQFPQGTLLVDILRGFPELQMTHPVLAARVNNVLQGLSFRVYKNKDVEFLDYLSPSARRVYVRSLCFILYKSTQELFPNSKLFVEHPISHGYFCHLRKSDDTPLTTDDISAIKSRMSEIIAADLPFCQYEVPTEDAIALFRSRQLSDKVRLLSTTGEVYSTYYTLGDTADYYYGPLVPSTRYIPLFDLQPYESGMLLVTPDARHPQQLWPVEAKPKLFDIYSEHMRWNIIMRLSSAGDVNSAIQNGRASELIQVSEALQEKKIVTIAEEINTRYHRAVDACRVVLISGPSSSGKTTFCKRLSVQLLACGLRPVSFSTDDYFVNRVDTPKLPNGEYDFDNISAVDTTLLSDHLRRLSQGETVEVPEYNFTTGQREYNGKCINLLDNKVLIIEGIHALNPLLTSQLKASEVYKVFISALTTVSLDAHNWIPTQDNRLLRRIIRDHNKGAFSAQQTIHNWKNVCAGEEQWITPYQETANIMFNSALSIEFALLRQHAEPMLATVPKNCPEYTEAHRLIRFLHYFLPISDKEIPPTSIMREFVGGSSFTY